MTFNFVFDRFVHGRPYPNLAPVVDISQGYQQLELEYPRIIPLRLLYYVNDHSYPHSIFNIDQELPHDSFYPVGIAWFNYAIDYFSLMSDRVLELCRLGKLKILFYYHEGDNPFKQKEYLDQLCVQHNLSVDCYCFISGNTQADSIPGFVYFPDHELFYWRCSHKQPVLPAHDRPRTHRFTALSRRHQIWRATVMAWLHQQGILEHSYWSYNTIGIESGSNNLDPLMNNPIRILPYHPDLAQYTVDFLSHAPYTCDTLDDIEHNTHNILVPEHYADSYCNLVLETFFDADQSGGAFLSEKIFKPIRHAQPFVVFGCAGSLQTLRDLGYRTFDHAIINHYDRFASNEERFNYMTHTMTQLNQQNLHAWYQSCLDDIEHNQQLFLSNKTPRLSNLYDKLLHQLATA
jgi:hypothetical protein